MDSLRCVGSVCCARLRLLCLPCDASIHMRTLFLQTSMCQKDQLERDSDEFRVFEIPGLKPRTFGRQKQRKKREMPPPRSQQMPVNQDWTNVWPSAATFKWSVVPFPVRQGMVQKWTENDGVIPSKYANAELMKIPNFLHLTPAHVKKHCAALKQFCTEWPAGLETDEDCRKHFPIEVQTSDYVFSGPSIRDPRAKLVTVTLHLSDLKLDAHAKDKFLRLVADCYNPKTGQVVFTSERCPMKQQNLDYIMYLLTASYHEAWKREAWEAEKTLEDMEVYVWEMNKSKDTVIQLLQTLKEADRTSSKAEERLQYLPEDTSESSLLGVAEVQTYKEAVSDLINDGETQEALDRYSQSVRALLGIQGLQQETVS